MNTKYKLIFSSGFVRLKLLSTIINSKYLFVFSHQNPIYLTAKQIFLRTKIKNGSIRLLPLFSEKEINYSICQHSSPAILIYINENENLILLLEVTKV